MTRQPSTFSYFVVMIDYGRKGFEATVSPEHTRRQIVEEVREVLASADRSLVHVKHIDGNYCEDVTAEIVAAAQFNDDVEAIGSALDAQAARFDHARDLRKHSEVA